MKISKQLLKRIIKEERQKLLNEEGADCIKDYMLMGYSKAQAYEECDDGSDDYRNTPSNYSRSSSRRKTSYVGSDANAEQISAVEAALSAKPNNFLTSVLKQLKNGRGLSSKQKSIVKSIIKKTDPGAEALFEAKETKMKITKRQLRRIIKEEKQKLLSEITNRHGIDVKFQRSLDDLKYSMEKELVAKLSIEDRKWWENEKNLEAAARMLDTLKETILGFGK